MDEDCSASKLQSLECLSFLDLRLNRFLRRRHQGLVGTVPFALVCRLFNYFDLINLTNDLV